jgi:hypothetical protein
MGRSNRFAEGVKAFSFCLVEVPGLRFGRGTGYMCSRKVSC